MKYAKIIETLTRTPLLMTPAAVESLHTLFQQHAALTAADFQLAREGKDSCGGKVELEKMEIEDSLAIIPVNGPLGVGLDAFEKGAGCTDYGDIISDVAAANENPAVQNIMLVMDTPGGMWGGLLECSEAIAESEKPVYCYVPAGGSCASAGMFLAASCAGRFLSPSAQAGSIGVYCAYTDMSERAKAMGIKVRVFSSGIYKGMGIPGTELTAEQEQLLQDNVMELADEFYNHIRASLGDIPEEAMQGQMFRADKAVEIGLADDVVKSIEQAKEYLR